MTSTSKTSTASSFAVVLCLLLAAAAAGCDMRSSAPGSSAALGANAEEEERGPNGGRMLRDGDFALELAIYEMGLPPELRVWVTHAGSAVAPEGVELTVWLTRLGGRVDEFRFRPWNDFLRGDGVVDEPHSFEVRVEALHAGRRYVWEYESFEGRTRIDAEMAHELGIETELAAPVVLREAVTLYGRIVPDIERVRAVEARFDGAIESVAVSVGDTVRQGQRLAVIESNESLQRYEITAPIAGVVTERAANPGEQTRGRRLFTLMDTASVWAELALFPRDRARVRSGAPVRVTPAAGGAAVDGVITGINVVANPAQSVTARAVLDNRDGALPPGLYVRADVEVAEHEVPLAVKRNALQSFRDFTVVYAQVGDVYEVRMLELGRQMGEWAEVLDGLEPGTRYVTEGSYLIKADIEKSGAVHDH
jgi:membrane fusion protein, heavy metal efflux system